MKHLLNNLSTEEKNSILEQHKGGMNLMIENFNKLVSTKLGNVKPLVNESEEFMSAESTTGIKSTMGKDPDHFGMYVKPAMIQAGFKLVDESNDSSFKWCKWYNGNCCKYFCYPNHDDGVNLFLDCGGDSYEPWKYVVYYGGNKGLKEFGWSTGTNDEVKKAAQDAVNYAINLKNKLYK